jgi:NADPH2:quinone reductase
VRAVVLRAFGPPEQLVAEDVPDPPAGPGELVVDVEAASITFVETQIRAGRPPHARMAPELPAILGNGVGGTVIALGAGADEALRGRRVVTTTGGSGGYAERAVANASAAIVVPDGLDMTAAVALLADGRTALSLVESAAPQPGETVLVLAAGGGVGSMLVQLAHRAGAYVVAAAGGERKLALARSLGAEATADYSRPGWAAEIGAGAIDVVFDGVGGALAATAFGLVRRGGRFVAFGRASGTFVPAQDAEAAGVTLVSGVPLTPERSRALSAHALGEAATGRLTPTVGQTFALEHAADAHAAIESRATLGKTLLLA